MTEFAIAALVLIMLPGPDQALITRNALVGGRSGGALTMLGGVLGVAVHAALAALGVSALLLASATAFTILKIVGAVYLLWLAAQMLWSARRTRRAPERTDALVAPQRRSACLRQGFLSNALNPKVALFFVTFLPQFLSGDTGSPQLQGLVLSGIFAILYLAWFSVYLIAVDRLGRWLRRPRVRARIEQVTGMVLGAVAVRLATAAH
ncbi:threonine/homoserine/homoserine lactone efflux protein [Herbihabitans rhizosphaerae]|uniref:Threonine/homoserine/homoserine lactone efflux protein n=1 Tax=Herbihabitans rhizosphaerae TaxID=1872711 RepID=A0A4V2ERF7_9PSEU|nr:LysE family translocator [Herbihabitans rhizosphaerae]RZS31153.1 threonine/homoserine/homoserine lactone efflux protein [Herbihabitans rhizosphaerae]